MGAPTRTLINAELARWLTGEATVEQFWEWLAPLQFSTRDDPAARQLLYQIIGRLDEYDHGDWTDEQLRQHLLALLPPDLATAVRQRIAASATPLAGL